MENWHLNILDCFTGEKKALEFGYYFPPFMTDYWYSCLNANVHAIASYYLFKRVSVCWHYSAVYVFLLIAFPSKKMLVLVKVNHLKIEKRGICVLASVMCNVMLTDCHYQGLSIRPFFFGSQAGSQSQSVSQSHSYSTPFALFLRLFPISLLLFTSSPSPSWENDCGGECYADEEMRWCEW